MFVLIIWSILLSSSFIDCGYYGEHGYSYNAYGENKHQIRPQSYYTPRTFDWSRRYHQSNGPFHRQPYYTYYNAYNDYSKRNDPRSDVGNNDVMKKPSTDNSHMAEIRPTIENADLDQYHTPGLRQLMQNMEEGNVFQNNSDYNPRSELQTTVDQFLYVERKIKAICNRGHNPSEEITEAHYTRMFNIDGYKPETAIVRIKQTVLYSCLDPVIGGNPCLEDVALLPEHLIIEEAVYNIENNKLTIKIPFKKNIKDLECNVCGGDEGNNDVMIVSKEIKKPSTGNSRIAEMRPTVRNAGLKQYHTPDVRQEMQNMEDMEEGIVFKKNGDYEYYD